MVLDDMMEENVVLKKRLAFMEDLVKVWKEEDRVREIKHREHERDLLGGEKYGK